ncbi:MAG TPA: hypothetical protein GXX24_00785 [Paracoccus solventivorans]|uniref:Opacity protein n=1 Tax=Paracoccus solventivorans TaxID=53463 RepID=A0A832PJU6_9RHOB|nr:hypothetical protein [Paracoccus solventivorans]HHW32668.1 hypothetical protein [Paracoccus solventivorans]
MTRIASVAALLLTTPAFAGGYVAPINSAPPVARPAASAHNWTGAYVGLSYGTQRTKSHRATYEDRELTETHRETRPYTKADLHRDLSQTGCADPDQVYAISYPSHSYNTTCANLLAHTPNAGWATATVDGAPPVIVREWSEVTGRETVETGTKTIRSSDSTAGVFAGYRHQLVGGTVIGVEASYARVGGEDSTRLMAQGGYSLGRVLPYLTAGYDLAQDAPVYGAGIDVALTRRLLGGLAYTRADDAERIEARLGWRW